MCVTGTREHVGVRAHMTAESVALLLGEQTRVLQTCIANALLAKSPHLRLAFEICDLVPTSRGPGAGTRGCTTPTPPQLTPAFLASF